MTTATIEEAQAHLATLIAQLKPGEEVVIVERDRPVARLVAERGEIPGSAARQRRRQADHHGGR
ncbi:MAG: type II toxin-antitoxin system Phd/YefM family antitoxin [Pirellulales bacterium]|nr:type II toxin-antitoxin system Phd/YefM family antitoxin [Pirellulales bacterium]